MDESNLLSYTKRLKQGENPREVFNEIEAFYVIRGFLNDLDPGLCGHTLDEYDSEAHHILAYILGFHASGKVLTSDELADYLRAYFTHRFGSVDDSYNVHHFTFGMTQGLGMLHEQKMRGKKLGQTLKRSEWKE